MDFEEGYYWLSKYLDAKVQEIKCDEAVYSLVIVFKFTLSIEKELKQRWSFPIYALVSQGELNSSIVIESSINNISKIPITLSEKFAQSCEFHAYFTHGSAPELSLSTGSSNNVWKAHLL
jgi:hypothetical protein